MRYSIILAILLLSCSSPVPEPVPVPDVADTELCGEAERNLEALQCKDAAGNPMWVNLQGERFESICTRAQEEGGIPLNPRCIMSAKTCEEAKTCPTR